MERKQFLRSLGAGAAFALIFPCTQSCSKSDGGDDVPEGDRKEIPSGVDFTIDLTANEAAPLANNGGFILVKSNVSPSLTDIVVAKNLEGNFVAASQICSHQQTDNVRFRSEDGGIFNCSTHGARFDQNGNPLNSITNNPLKIFNTALSGDILRIFE
ncbi:QcrA and Rieske domain-containing protein [Costertonia aggregata]|uniref:Rieske 2Fe-2S domain-containing protein n=1 Tax=Costertonia aggregata TaxID=343403 RepID=A0A7H9AS00_9FLAO|nr:Rieske 2Fe-2S domain-containing protein [Costertonia aggregata]QLG46233.1 Rieske 2Fe-2S domain-containing protein [Costertonia aggregata]